VNYWSFQFYLLRKSLNNLPFSIDANNRFVEFVGSDQPNSNEESDKIVEKRFASFFKNQILNPLII
jgi:bisphosphoglycerate-dependent phosphoglycerate mutase